MHKILRNIMYILKTYQNATYILRITIFKIKSFHILICLFKIQIKKNTHVNMYLKVDQILKILPYKYSIYFRIRDKQDNTFRLCSIPIKYYKKKKNI